jgi:hypothetical protein
MIIIKTEEEIKSNENRILSHAKYQHNLDLNFDFSNYAIQNHKSVEIEREDMSIYGHKISKKHSFCGAIRPSGRIVFEHFTRKENWTWVRNCSLTVAVSNLLLLNIKKLSNFHSSLRLLMKAGAALISVSHTAWEFFKGLIITTKNIFSHL